MRVPKRRLRGFTAVEITIVIAILGLLAAVAIPQIAGNPQDEATRLVGCLGQLRTAINRYWVQHDDFPGPSAEDVRRQLTSRTCRAGNCGDGPAFVYGPYVPDGLPESPVSGTSTLTIVDAMPEAPSGSSAWIY